MKNIKKLINLILITIIIAIPSYSAKAADRIEVPISVEWTYKGKPWANSPHTTNVVIEAKKPAPASKLSSFDHAGSYIISFKQPNFNQAGRYEYIIRQTNQDFNEENFWVTYDKKVYRLIFYVQESNGTLTTVAYAYDESKYDSSYPTGSKVEKIVFTNDDPHIHRHDGTIIDEENPYHPYHPDNPSLPEYPTNPTDPTNPTNPPLKPTNPDRNDENTPIYTTEPEDGEEDKVINPEPWEKLDQPTPSTPTPPQPGPNPDDGSDGNIPFPWWPWKPTPNPTEPEEPIKDSTGDSTVDNENPTQPIPGDSDLNDPINESKTPADKSTGKDKTSHTNVQTGIESVAIWAIILIISMASFILTNKRTKKIKI